MTNTSHTTGTATHQLVFIDSRVPDLQSIIAAAQPGVKVVVLNPAENGVAQMAKALQGEHGLSSISVVSHGDDGVLLLGNGPLHAGNLDQHQAELKAIGEALGPDGDLLLYGCDVGAGEVGAQFMQALAQLTGADVAASDDDTGGEVRGSDWDLEITTGVVGHDSAIDVNMLSNYEGNLATLTASTIGELRTALTTAATNNQSDTITLLANITATGSGDLLASATDGHNTFVDINITDSQTLDIVGGGNTLDANYHGRVLEIRAGTVTLDSLVITHGSISGAGGNGGTSSTNGGSALGAGIANAGTLTINNTTVTANGAAGGGGGSGVAGANVGGGGGGGGPLINGADKGTGASGGSAGSGAGEYSGLAGSLGAGGQGGGYKSNAGLMGGRGGASNGGAGGQTYAGYSAGGDGATAVSGTLRVGGGGGATGWDATGKVGGIGIGGIYNAVGGIVTVIGTSAITNNVGAGGGGGGGGGGSVNGGGATDHDGGAGGLGGGGVYNLGTFNITASNFAAMTGNVGVSGSGGLENGTGDTGTVPTAITKVGGTGTNNTAYVLPAALTSATYDAATGILTGTGINLTNGGAIDVSKLSLTGQAGSYTLTTANVTASSTTAFSVTLNTADKVAVNGVLNNNGTVAVGGTTFNLAAAANWEVTTSASADLSGNAVTVSNVTAPTITSATYDGATHVFTVTGTGLVKTVGATNDVTVSTLTITGEGGATRTLSTTGNVEVTSATSFTFTLAGADIAAVDALLNKNGSTSASSATAYNLAAADDWNSVVTGGDITDATNAITVSNAAPSISSATYDAATGTLSVSALNIVGGDTIDVSKLSITGQGGSYTLTTASVTASSSTAFAVTLNAADKLAINGILNNNGTTAIDTTNFNLAGATGWNSTVGAAADTTGNAVTVSNVTAPTITSATYDGTSGILTVTGTGLVQTIGATNDITVSALTITGEGGATRTLSTTGNVEVTSATSFTLTLAGADASAVASLLNKNGTSSASSATTYNIAAADDWNSVVTGGDIADLTGNGITVSNAAPSILSATYDAATGVLTATGVNLASGGNVVVGNLTLTGQGGATYTLTTGNVTASSTTDFSVTLNAADQLSVNGLLNNNGTSSATGPTPFNLAAAANWQAGAGADLTGNAVTVSNVAAPTITSASYDGSTNTLVVTGTGLVKTIGATNDITVSALTITGEGGATRTLSTTGNVEVTSATSFTLTLAGADASAVASLLNKNGTSSASSATTYNIAAADDWNSVVTGGDIADLTGNGITVSNAAPSIVGATYDAATGILSVSAVNMVAGDTIDVSQLSLVGQAGGSYTLTTANTTATNATAFSITLNAADQLAVGGILNTNGSSAVDATAFNLAALASWNASRPTGADPTGNAVTVSNVSAPTITSATYDATTHILTVTGTGLVKTLGATNDITVSALSITGEGGVARTLSTTGNVEVLSATSFAVTLAGADVAAVEALFNKNGSTSTGGTAYNLAAADDWNSVVTGGSIADATSAITVSNVPPPTITSATYDAATGALVVTGTGFSGASGAANDIVANRFSLQGEGGASHTLTTTGNVEITSATSFTLTLSAADKAAVNALANKNGTSSTSANTYNLAAAEDWAAGTDAVVAVADASNGVTVANVAAPTVTSATYNVATGVLVVTGTGLLGAHGAANDILANRLTFTGKAASTYTLTDTANADVTSATAFSLTLSTTDKAGVNLLLDKAGTSSVDNTTYNIALAEDWNAGADAAVVIADLTGNAVTAAGFPSDDGGGTPTPPTGTPIDGVPVVTEPGPGGSTIITIPVVVPTRPDTPGTPSPLADIPLVTSPSGTPIVSVGVPTGVGLQAEGLTTTTTGSAALAELGFRIERIAGDSPELTNAGQVFYATLAPNEPLSVQILKPTIGAGYDGSQPLVITGSNNPADGKQAVIVDARSLPSGTVIQVDDVEFLAVVGAVRIIGGAGQNAASGDSAGQWIVLGPDDDTIHGGGGNDVVGSEGGDDQVYGDAGDDIVFGGAGNDLLSGGTGSDKLNGGTGFDVAIQEGQKTDYTVTLEGAGIKLTHTASGVSDWLVDVEQVRFATGPSLTVAHSAAEEAGAYLFQKWIGRDLNQGEGAIIQSLTGKTALEVATLFAQFFPEQSAGKTPAQLLEGMAAAGAVRVDAIRDVTVTGDAGHNTINPTLGLARYVDGGAGTDTVVIPATLGQTHVQAHGNGSFTLQRLTDGAMLDTTRVERVTFSDTKLALDLDGNAGQAAKLLGALGGPGMLANKGVVGEVIRLLDAGATSQTIAGLGLQLLGANTPTQIAQTLWTNVVGRAGTDGELKLLTDLMAGGVSAGELVVIAANLDANAVRIDLVGLTAKGIEFA
ncbi:DUF4347 domain-containing protein [Acidovorax sp.]|uniref:DUF4347 domain-containing protein n=1 Tax=Acidovorax sp. TaxID=1872122 RepID=UPI002ACDB251|nr:DUF4347 domain-containing protein [Acidovorax sp.]MDZ7863174.1 DUF4347 domain-containing protein [Acidovorax sp.]